MLTNTSFRSLHKFKNSGREMSRGNSNQSIGFFVPKEQRDTNITEMRNSSLHMGNDTFRYVSAANEHMIGGNDVPAARRLVNTVERKDSRLSSSRGLPK